MRRKYKTYILGNLRVKGFGQFFNFIRAWLSLGGVRIKHPPLLAILIPTRRCNLKCEMCDLWKREGKEMSKREIFRLVDDLEELGVTTISLSGGEPFMREDILEIMSYIKDKGMLLDVSTNGTLITGDLARRLVEVGVDTVSVSLDSDDPEIFDKLRGRRGAHKRVVQGIMNLLEAADNRPEITVNILLSPQTMYRVMETVDFLYDLGVRNIGVIPVHNFTGKKSLRFSEHQKREIKHVVEWLMKTKKEKGIIDNTEKYLEAVKSFLINGERQRACGAGFLTLVVDSNGDLYPCYGMFELGEKIGNIRDTDLRELWYSETYETLRSNLLTCKKCVWNCQEELNIVFDSVLRREYEDTAHKP